MENSIKIIRESKNLTQKQVCETCNISTSVYSRYESGQRNPSLKKAQALAKALGCTIDELLAESEVNTEKTFQEQKK